MLPWNHILGHRQVLDALGRAVASGRLHHALLLTGPEGVGKALTLRALAAALNCQARPPGAFTPGCGQCPSCRKTAQDLHPDVVWIEPRGATLKIDQIRDLVGALTSKPFEGGRRVVALQQAHRMTPQAANALLKTLEEPGQRTHLALITDQPGALLDTIRSRCQPLRFAPLPRDTVLQILGDLHQRGDDRLAGADAASLEVAAGFADGSVARALALLAGDGLGDRASLLDELEQVVGQGSTQARVSLAERWGRAERAQLPERISLLTVLLRDAVRARIEGQNAPLINGDMAARIHHLAGRTSVDALLQSLEGLQVADEQLERNLNPQLVVESLLASLAAGLSPISPISSQPR